MDPKTEEMHATLKEYYGKTAETYRLSEEKDEAELATKTQGGIGRIGRVTFLWLCLGFWVTSLTGGLFLDILSSSASPDDDMSRLFGEAGVMLALAAGFYMVSVARLHDRNQSGWVALIGLIPIVGMVLQAYLLLMLGTEGDNEYGPPASGVFR